MKCINFANFVTAFSSEFGLLAMRVVKHTQIKLLGTEKSDIVHLRYAKFLSISAVPIGVCVIANRR
jgi:hypothetical protein